MIDKVSKKTKQKIAREKRQRDNPLWKVILTDLAGVGCLLLVPFLGPLPGPGGIPLLLAGFGFLAVNHDWADSAVDYIKERSESFRGVVFPPNPKIELLWDVVAVVVMTFGIFVSVKADSIDIIGDFSFELPLLFTSFNFDNKTFVVGLSIAIMAVSTTILMMNRSRIDWLDKQLRRTGKK